MGGPAPGDPPARVWRDRVLVGLLVVWAVLETLLRPDLVWRPVVLLDSVVVALSLLWRRSHNAPCFSCVKRELRRRTTTGFGRPVYGDGMTRRNVDDLLRESRRGLSRVTPYEAARQLSVGAHLIDVRTRDQIARGGRIPGALEVSLNVLEWRLDPDSPSRHPEAPPLDAVVIVVCHEGFCSSLAAARLQAIGFHAATDVIGGFQAWRQSGGHFIADSGT